MVLKSFSGLVGFMVWSFMIYAQDFAGVSYGPETRQFLDIYLAPSNCPTPVYFNAHSNGGTTAMPASITNSLTSNGISVVSWESLTAVSTPAQVDTGWDDAELMFEWVLANASTYNFDTTNLIIGGSSRGTILSWKYAHTPNPNIKGLYMYNALPSNAWRDSTWWYPPNDVTVLSPPIFFVYRREPGSSTDPVDPDIHDPNNGITIQNRYNSLGIGDRDTLIHSIQDSASSDRYQYLLEFANSVIEPCWTVGLNTNLNETSSVQAYPNPFHESIQLHGLSGGEYFILRNTMGQIVAETNNIESIDLPTLDAGIYLLTIKFATSDQVIKLMKH